MHQGLGTRLMDMILRHNQGKIVELEVDFYNKNAFKFYEKYDFKVVSMKMKRG